MLFFPIKEFSWINNDELENKSIPYLKTVKTKMNDNIITQVDKEVVLIK